MKIAVLAVQGAFIEHGKRLSEMGIESFELRCKNDLLKSFDGLILPGGESTVQGKLLRDLDMFEPLKKQIEDGLPVMATCAGMILLAKNIINDERKHFATLPVTVKRNAYGRQLGSFYTKDNFADIGTVPMTFIRAPYIENANKDVGILSIVNGNITAVKYKNQLAMSFHPELDNDLRIHNYFINMI